MCFMDALQITLTLLHSTGMSGESDGEERRAGKGGMEMEMGERANETTDGQGNRRSEIEQNEWRASVRDGGERVEVVQSENCSC